MARAPLRRLLGLGLAGLGLAAGCRGPSASPSASPPATPAAPPDVLLVSIDALRPDHLGCYGYGRPTSPGVDALAREGTLFENAFTPATWTLPGHSSMLSGVSPYRHGAVESTTRIHDDVPLLAEALAARGYDTGAVINGPYVASDFGLNRGFARYVERYRKDRDLEHYQPLVLSTLRALKRPFFLFVHYISVHSPYDPSPEYNRFLRPGGQELVSRGKNAKGLRQLELDIESGKVKVSAAQRRRLEDLYDGEILSTDTRLQELVAELRRRSDRAVVVLTADHGEEFMEHGGLTHGRTLYEEVLRVPLVVAGPGVPRGRRVSEMASLLDVTPTILDLVGAAVGGGLDGASLRLLFKGPAPAFAHRVLPLHTRSGDSRVDLWGVRTSTAKLIVDRKTGAKEYYDLVADPGERTNLYPRPEAAPLERALDALVLRPPEARRVVQDAEQIEVLKSLGYK